MKFSKGFTLIELIVVMAVFLLIIGTALGIFISIVFHQRRILAQQELLSQASYVVEYMAKGFRMAGKDLAGDCVGEGYTYKLQNFSDGAWQSIKFINQSDNNTCQEFFLDGSVLKERKNGADPVQVTGANLKINSLKFSINGNEPSDQSCEFAPSESCGTGQPRVTILLDIKSQGDENQPETRVQTTVSQRDLNK